MLLVGSDESRCDVMIETGFLYSLAYLIFDAYDCECDMKELFIIIIQRVKIKYIYNFMIKLVVQGFRFS